MPSKRRRVACGSHAAGSNTMRRPQYAGRSCFVLSAKRNGPQLSVHHSHSWRRQHALICTEHRCLVTVTVLRRFGEFTLEEFRAAVARACSSGEEHIVVSYSRKPFLQTGALSLDFDLPLLHCSYYMYDIVELPIGKTTQRVADGLRTYHVCHASLRGS